MKKRGKKDDAKHSVRVRGYRDYVCRVTEWNTWCSAPVRGRRGLSLFKLGLSAEWSEYTKPNQKGLGKNIFLKKTLLY